MILIFELYGYFERFNSKKKFTHMKFHGLIELKSADAKGFPSIKLNTQKDWIYLGNFGKPLYDYLHEGDSISKNNNDLFLTIYRKSSISVVEKRFDYYE